MTAQSDGDFGAPDVRLVRSLLPSDAWGIPPDDVPANDLIEPADWRTLMAGQSVGTTFAMDAGRLCVMCSRHRVACMLIGRPGLAKAAAAGQGSTERRFGDDDDPARMGWRAHSVLLGG